LSHHHAAAAGRSVSNEEILLSDSARDRYLPVPRLRVPLILHLPRRRRLSPNQRSHPLQNQVPFTALYWNRHRQSQLRFFPLSATTSMRMAGQAVSPAAIDEGAVKTAPAAAHTAIFPVCEVCDPICSHLLPSLFHPQFPGIRLVACVCFLLCGFYRLPSSPRNCATVPAPHCRPCLPPIDPTMLQTEDGFLCKKKRYVLIY
ncbi:unnamed protein product, partial [Urochloa humidicola]